MFRKNAGITQIELAKEIGISIATLRRWEAGETAPTGANIPALANILGVTPEDIVASNPDTQNRTAATINSGMLIFEQGGTRIELPPTERGYEIFNNLVENMIKKERETQK